jgi:hypothetical protein
MLIFKNNFFKFFARFEPRILCLGSQRLINIAIKSGYNCRANLSSKLPTTKKYIHIKIVAAANDKNNIDGAF